MANYRGGCLSKISTAAAEYGWEKEEVEAELMMGFNVVTILAISAMCRMFTIYCINFT